MRHPAAFYALGFGDGGLSDSEALNNDPLAYDLMVAIKLLDLNDDCQGWRIKTR